jgi:hypothetical protein
MPPKTKTKARGKAIIEPQEGPKGGKENDAKHAKELHDDKTLMDTQPKSPKEVEKGVKDLKDFDVKPFKEKDLKELGEIKYHEADKWFGEGLPVGFGGQVEGDVLAQLLRRVANLEAIVARGQAFIQPKERPLVGANATKKRGR